MLACLAALTGTPDAARPQAGGAIVGFDVFVAVGEALLRANAALNAPVLGRAPCGERVMVTERGVEWVRVRSSFDGTSGWVRGDMLRLVPPTSCPRASEPVAPTASGIAPAAPMAAGAVPLGPVATPRQDPPRIAATPEPPRAPAPRRTARVGTCLCPDDLDRAGRRCGRRSAYYRPGGARPACF